MWISKAEYKELTRGPEPVKEYEVTLANGKKKTVKATDVKIREKWASFFMHGEWLCLYNDIQAVELKGAVLTSPNTPHGETVE